MENNPEKTKSKAQMDYSQHIKDKAALKMKAKKGSQETVWFGLGMMGMIGWSVVVPTLLGIALGRWLDVTLNGSLSWTLMMFALGLALGCLNAWHWVKKEDKAMHETNTVDEGKDSKKEEHVDE